MTVSHHHENRNFLCFERGKSVAKNELLYFFVLFVGQESLSRFLQVFFSLSMKMFMSVPKEIGFFC